MSARLELIDLFNRKPNLVVQINTLQIKMYKLGKTLEKLNTMYEKAQQVTQVINGVPLHVDYLVEISSSGGQQANKNYIIVRRLDILDKPSASADVYKCKGINKFGILIFGKNISFSGFSPTQTFVKADALKIAKNWVTKEKLPKDIETQLKEYLNKLQTIEGKNMPPTEEVEFPKILRPSQEPA